MGLDKGLVTKEGGNDRLLKRELHEREEIVEERVTQMRETIGKRESITRISYREGIRRVNSLETSKNSLETRRTLVKHRLRRA